MGTALSWRWGLWAPRIPQILLFRNPKGRRLLRVPQSGPQNPAYGGAKISGDPVQTCVRRALWRYHYLQAFSGVDTGAPGINAVYDCLAVSEPHQWWWALWLWFLPGTVSSVPSPWARKLWAMLEKYARLSAGTFFSLNVLSIWVPGHNSVTGNVTCHYVFFTTTTLCYSISWGLDLPVHFRIST